MLWHATDKSLHVESERITTTLLFFLDDGGGLTSPLQPSGPLDAHANASALLPVLLHREPET